MTYSDRSRRRWRSFRAMMWSSSSRRQLPTQRSATPFCQGLWMEVRKQVMLMDRIAAGTSKPQLREAESGFRYTPNTTFETFPFPWSPGKEPHDNPQAVAIAEPARDLAQKRDAWLNPAGASSSELKKRTLTNLYN